MVNEDELIPYKASGLPVDNGPWLVFAPHADDESFAMGGTLAKAVDKGITVHLVVMTDGALGGDFENIVETRKQEAIKAAAILGLQAPVFLNFSDRRLSLEEKFLDSVRNEIDRVAPAAVFFPGCFELHPDHRATAALVWRALANTRNREIVPVSYEVLVQSPINSLVDISPYWDRKLAAMESYASQLTGISYIDIARAMNQLRALTLGGEISHAEGFFRFDNGDPEAKLKDVVLATLETYFRV